jgi:hypothetical protein
VKWTLVLLSLLVPALGLTQGLPSPAAASSSSSGITLSGSFGSTPTTAGATLSAGTLQLQPADGTHSGGVSTAAQSFAGAKTFGAEAANQVTLAGATTGNPATVTASGSDSNVGLKLVGKGSGSFFWDNNFNIDSTGVVTAQGVNSAGAVGAGGAFQPKDDGTTVTVKGLVGDSGSSVGVIIDNSHTLSTTGAKILSIRNNTAEKVFFDLNGTPRFNHITCAMSAATTCTATVPTGSVCQCQATSGTAIAQSCNVSTTTATCTANGSNSNTWNIHVE